MFVQFCLFRAKEEVICNNNISCVFCQCTTAMMYHNTRVNNSTSYVEEMPLVRSQFMQEALNQRQYENRQAIIRHTSTHQR